MEFRLLGDLEICDQGRTLPLSSGKQKALVAVLLLNANRVVPVDRLIDELWGGEPSPKVASNLHALVSRLRARIGPERLERHGCGYVLRVEDDELDVRRFEQLRDEARHALERGEPDEAAATLRHALDLWRGPALADFTYEPWAGNEIRRLEEDRLVVLEERIEADLAAARHTELVGELQALVAEHPLRETFRSQLILALYRSGRQAEALEAYRAARKALDEELGLEPSSGLRELEGAVLRQDSSLELPRRPTARAAAPAPSHQQRRSSRRARLGLAAAAAMLAFGATAGAAALIRMDGGKPKPTEAAAASHSTADRKAVTPVPASKTATRKAVLAQPVSRRVRRAPTARTKRVVRSATRAAEPPTVRTLAARRPTAVMSKAPTSKPKSKPKPTPKPDVFVMDDFADGEINRHIWHDALAGTGVTVEERGGRLEIALSDDAQPGGPYNLIEGHYGTQCRFVGDYDARVDFELLDWPVANGVIVELAAWSGTGSMTAGRQSQSWDQGEGYTASSPGFGTQVEASDLRGTLRIRRAGLTTTSYYWGGTKWVRLVPFVPSPNSTIGAPLFGLQAMSTGQTFAAHPVRIAFDNFVLTAQQSVC